jgi:hypothetical protein
MDADYSPMRIIFFDVISEHVDTVSKFRQIYVNEVYISRGIWCEDYPNKFSCGPSFFVKPELILCKIIENEEADYYYKSCTNPYRCYQIYYEPYDSFHMMNLN